MPTFREKINERLRWHPWIIPFAPLMAALILGAIFIKMDLIWVGIGLAILFSCWGIFAAIRLGLCPQCSSPLLPLCSYQPRVSVGRSLLPEKVKYCPICGLDFDQPSDKKIEPDR